MLDGTRVLCTIFMYIIRSIIIKVCNRDGIEYIPLMYLDIFGSYVLLVATLVEVAQNCQQTNLYIYIYM